MLKTAVSRRVFAWVLLLGAVAPITAAEPTVSLTVDYGDGVEKKFTALAWKEGLTVLDALSAAAKHPRGVKIDRRGNGELAFVTAIDDVKNDGGKNWLYFVNEKAADRSCGIYALKSGDAVVWKFTAEMP